MEPKKNYEVDEKKKSPWLLSGSLAITLALVWAGFEFIGTYDDQTVDLMNMADDFEEIIEIPPTDIPPPPPPKIQQPEIVEVPDEEEIEEEIEIELDMEIDEETVVEEIIIEDTEPQEEVVEEIFTVVEESASFPGGIQEFYKYVGDNLEYPSSARRMGIEGRVFVQFVVDKDGSLTQIEVVKGINDDMDNAAKQVFEDMPYKWKPGKQRGRPVRQRMVIPITFKLAR